MISSVQAHEDHRQRLRALNLQAWEATNLALGTLATLNSGAIVAILALVGTLIQSGKVTVASSIYVKVLAIFFVGLELTLLPMFCAFFASTSYANSDQEDQLVFDPPYVISTTKSARLSRRGNWIRLVGIIFASLAFVAAVLGAIAFANFAESALNAREAHSRARVMLYMY